MAMSEDGSEARSEATSEATSRSVSCEWASCRPSLLLKSHFVLGGFRIVTNEEFKEGDVDTFKRVFYGTVEGVGRG